LLLQQRYRLQPEGDPDRPPSRAGIRLRWSANRRRALADLERTFTVLAGADAAYEFLADPMSLPQYVPTMQLVDSIAVEGELDVDADLRERDGAPDAGFVADRKTRHIEWGRPANDYRGSIDVAEGTTNTAAVTVRLHTRDDADAAEVTRVFDQAVANIRRLLMGR